VISKPCIGPQERAFNTSTSSVPLSIATISAPRFYPKILGVRLILLTGRSIVNR